MAQQAMFITYCLSVDKLYIKDHIADNFKYFFQWSKKVPSSYVALNDFKHYIMNAYSDVLI